jgi:gluconolactonase
MSWNFERVAGPFQGAMGGLAWNGKEMLFSVVDEGFIKKFDPESGKVSDFRAYTARVNGIAVSPDGHLYGCQEGGRRVIRFLPDGSATITATRLNGRVHNYPNDLVIDRGGRIWFSDPYSKVMAFGPQIFPPLEHASVLRLEYDERHAWTIRRVTFDTTAPRAVLLSADEKTLYVAEGDATQDSARELRAYPIREDGSVGPFVVLHTFGSDHLGAHRGIEGMTLDADGNIVACAGWKKSGPGPLIYVFSPSGRILETHAFPADAPMRCAFGDKGLDSFYVTASDGCLYRANRISRWGADVRWLST